MRESRVNQQGALELYKRPDGAEKSSACIMEGEGEGIGGVGGVKCRDKILAFRVETGKVAEGLIVCLSAGKQEWGARKMVAGGNALEPMTRQELGLNGGAELEVNVGSRGCREGSAALYG